MRIIYLLKGLIFLSYLGQFWRGLFPAALIWWGMARFYPEHYLNMGGGIVYLTAWLLVSCVLLAVTYWQQREIHQTLSDAQTLAAAFTKPGSVDSEQLLRTLNQIEDECDDPSDSEGDDSSAETDERIAQHTQYELNKENFKIALQLCMRHDLGSVAQTQKSIDEFARDSEWPLSLRACLQILLPHRVLDGDFDDAEEFLCEAWKLAGSPKKLQSVSSDINDEEPVHELSFVLDNIEHVWRYRQVTHELPPRLIIQVMLLIEEHSDNGFLVEQEEFNVSGLILPAHALKEALLLEKATTLPSTKMVA